MTMSSQQPEETTCLLLVPGGNSDAHSLSSTLSTVSLDRPKVTLQAAAHACDVECITQWTAYLEGLLPQERCQLLDAPDQNGLNALHYLAESKNSQLVEKLVELGADRNITDSNGMTPLHHAAQCGRGYVIAKLIDPEGNIKARDKNGRTPLLTAAAHGKNVIDSLLRGGACLEDKDEDDKTVIHLAVESGSHTVLKKLLTIAHRKGVLPNVCSQKTKKTGDIPLHIAVSQGDKSAVEELLLPGPSRRNTVDVKDHICAQNNHAKTPAHIAAEGNHHEILKLLVEKNKSCVSCKDADGNTPLHLACRGGHSEVVVEILICNEGKNCLNETNTQGKTPLHIAVDHDKMPDGHMRIVDSVLEQSSVNLNMLNVQDAEAMTALHYACSNGHNTVVQKLLDAGADVKLKNHKKHNPLDLAIKMGHKDVASTIIKCDEWRDALKNKSGRHRVKTPLRRLIKNMPDVAKEVLDRCTEEKRKFGSKEYTVEFDYQFVEDFQERRRIDLHSLGRHRQYIPNQDSSENWKPTAFRKQNHPLKIMVNNKRLDLMKHPLVISLLNDKWDKFGGYLYLANLMLFALFVVFLTVFALTVPNPQRDYCKAVFNGTFGNSSCIAHGANADQQRAALAMAVLTMIFAVVRLIVEFIQLLQLKWEYFLDWVNYIEVPLFVFSIIFCAVFGTTCFCPYNFQWQFGIIAVLLGWLNLIFFLRNLPKSGIYIGMLLHISRTFLKTGILAFLLILAFSFAFYMAFFDPTLLRTPASTPATSIFAIISMTAGGPDMEVFRVSYSGENEAAKEIPFLVVSYVVWLVFVVVMPIILINMLIGLAVDDIKSIKEAAIFQRIALKVDLVLNTETSFLFRALFARRIKRTRKFHPFRAKHPREKALDAVKYFFWGDDLVYSLEDFHRDPEDPLQTQLQKLVERVEELARNQQSHHVQ